MAREASTSEDEGGSMARLGIGSVVCLLESEWKHLNSYISAALCVIGVHRIHLKGNKRNKYGHGIICRTCLA
jgi:hypothetical protein